jgi:hypothetical protein
MQFSEELVSLVDQLAMKYHDAKAEGGRRFHFLAGAYPVITKQMPTDDSPVRLE